MDILYFEKKNRKSLKFINQKIKISFKLFNLDDIEHGILRKYRYKFSLVYLPNIFASKLLKNLAVSKIDYRIHFALNCGDKSCPSIAFYNHDTINSQLDLAKQSFLDSETKYNTNNVYISSLFKWYLGDFKSYDSIRYILKKQLNRDISKLKITFKPYNLKEYLNNFIDISI